MPDELPGDELLELAYPYALDALPDADRDAVERMLARTDSATAAAFRDTVRALRDTLADMTMVDAVPAPPTVEQALLRALDEQDAQTRVHTHRGRWLAAAAAIVLAVGLGVGIAVVRSDSEESGELTAQQVLVHTDTRSSTAPVAGGGSMTVHRSRELDAATVAFDAVPAAPSGHTYQMWLIGSDDRPRSAGVIDTLPGDKAPMLVRIGDAGQVAMSIEPVGGSPAPTDPRVVAPLR